MSRSVRRCSSFAEVRYGRRRLSAITVIQLQDDAPGGLLDRWAAGHGLALEVCRPDRGQPLPDRVAAAIVLGSDRSITDPSVVWLPDLRRWTAAVLAADTPALGICFGAQLMATALGASASRMAAPEIGWITIDTDDPELTPGPWFAWHEDCIGRSEALRVVAGNARGIQAFRASGCSDQLGVQFHPEVTPAIVDDWRRADGGRSLAAAGTTSSTLVRDTRRHAAGVVASAHALFDGWARSAALL